MEESTKRHYKELRGVGCRALDAWRIAIYNTEANAAHVGYAGEALVFRIHDIDVTVQLIRDEYHDWDDYEPIDEGALYEWHRRSGMTKAAARDAVKRAVEEEATMRADDSYNAWGIIATVRDAGGREIGRDEVWGYEFGWSDSPYNRDAEIVAAYGMACEALAQAREEIARRRKLYDIAMSFAL